MSKNKDEVVEKADEEVAVQDEPSENTEPKKGGGKRHFESKFDPDKLRELIKEGKNAQQIAKATGLSSLQSLRSHLMKLMELDQTFYAVPGIRKSLERKPISNFQGDIILRRNWLKKLSFDYPHGTEFNMELDDEGRLILSCAEDAT